MEYLQVDVTFKGAGLRLFFTRRHGQANGRMLVTTDRSLSFTKAYEIYAIRWGMEVYFKESKQLPPAWEIASQRTLTRKSRRQPSP
jgi:hypothetical protein